MGTSPQTAGAGIMSAMNASKDSPSLQDRLRRLPSVDALLQQPAIANLLDEYPREELLRGVRAVLDTCRERLRAGEEVPTDTPALALAIRTELRRRSLPNLRRVVNATGIVLHTGLGRAPLCEEAVAAVAEVAGAYCNLEFDLEHGSRGDRHEHVRDLLRELTGAEDGLVVNNNAAGTYLALNTLAQGAEVIVSRGQLVEIGGSYRMPDIMSAAGCRMVEVGTTNRTRLEDYARALTQDTAVLLRVHTSNYRVRGFVESVALEELVELAHRHGRWVVDDLGSGLLDRRLPWPEPVSPPGLSPTGEAQESQEAETEGPGPQRVGVAPPPAISFWEEPSVRESVSTGADLVLFSGDKLLGGPQAGLIVGRAELIARLRKNPLARTFRPDKMTLAGLEATLRLYRDPAALVRRHPVFRMLSADPVELEKAAVQLEHAVSRALPEAEVNSVPDVSEAGGGTLPTLEFPTWTVRIRHPRHDSTHLAAALRQRELPVVCRLQDECLVCDCRTLLPGDTEQIASALAEVVRELPPA